MRAFIPEESAGIPLKLPIPGAGMLLPGCTAASHPEVLTLQDLSQPSFARDWFFHTYPRAAYQIGLLPTPTFT